MRTVAIAGVGLIGGSFGLALRRAGFTGEIIGVSSPSTLSAALKLGAISSGATLETAAKQADLIYLAQPVDRILETLAALGPMLRPGCLVTDAGSTKVMIVDQANASLPPGCFLGGHPLAGKEQRGVESADPDLFRDRPYVLTPSGSEPPAAGKFREWLARFGSKVLQMSPAEHDAAVAYTSHLPQLLSTSLAATLASQDNGFTTQVFGPGLLDMTRLALSSPDLWQSILSTNQAEVRAALDSLIKSLRQVRESIGTEDLTSFFSIGKTFAMKIRNVDY